MGKDYVSPIYQIKRVPLEKIQANAYNPNAIAPPEMKLLEQSILDDGYTMPIVCYYLKEEDKYEIIDGFHRYLVMKRCPAIAERENYHLPVSIIDHPLSERMVSTIRHNRARGAHSIELMTAIVTQLVEAGYSDKWIIKKVGMDRDELLRLKQLSGLSSLFANKDFSQAWVNDQLV